MGNNLKIFKKNYNNVAGFIATDINSNQHTYIQSNTIPLTIEANGIYHAPQGTTYGPVIVNITDLSLSHMDDVDLTSWKGLVELSMSGNAPAYLEVGGTIDGTYTLPNGTVYDYPWIVVDFQTVELENGVKYNNIPILQAKYLLPSYTVFDAKEPENPTTYYKNYGDDQWSRSYIRQFLNSSGTGWWTAQSEYDVAVSTTATGFMSYMPSEMINSIHKIKKSTAKWVTLGTDMDITYDKFWIASLNEMNFVCDGNQIYEGDSWEYYKRLLNSETPIARGTYSQMIRYRCSATTSACVWWVRSNKYTANGVYDVRNNGNANDASAPYNTSYYALPCTALI